MEMILSIDFFPSQLGLRYLIMLFSVYFCELYNFVEYADQSI